MTKKGKLLPKKWRDLRMKGTTIQTKNRYVSTLTEVFLNQRRINVCGHTVKMTPLCVHAYL